MIVRWDQTGNGGSSITGYTFTLTQAGAAPRTIDLDASTMHVLVDGLVIGTTYNAKISATNAVGTSAETSSEEFTFANPPSSPESADTMNVDGAIKIKWVEPSSSNGSPITSYDVLVNHHYDHTWTTPDECSASEDGKTADGR